MRHANAGEPKLNPAKDAKRPLDKLGIEQSHDVGRALAALDHHSRRDHLQSADARHADRRSGGQRDRITKNKIVTDDALRPEASYEQFQDLLRRYSRKDAIMVVGHNPSMTEFLNKLLSGSARRMLVELKKGAVAKVEKEGRKAAVLKWCMPPKVVRSIQQASASSSRPKTVSK